MITMLERVEIAPSPLKSADAKAKPKASAPAAFAFGRSARANRCARTDESPTEGSAAASAAPVLASCITPTRVGAQATRIASREATRHENRESAVRRFANLPPALSPPPTARPQVLSESWIGIGAGNPTLQAHRSRGHVAPRRAPQLGTCNRPERAPQPTGNRRRAGMCPRRTSADSPTGPFAAVPARRR